MKNIHKKNTKFWLAITCIVLAIIWYCFVAVCFVGLNAVTDTALAERPGVYYVLLSVGSMLILFIAAALATPFAVWAFKKLKVQAPLLSSVSFFMGLVFASTLFSFVISLTYFEPTIVYVVLAASIVAAMLLYGFVVRPLKHKLSTRSFVLLSVGIAIVPLILYVLQRLWMHSI